VFFIYAFGGRYRQWARLFLLASLIEPGLFWALSHVMVLGIDSVNGMLCIMWAVGQISCAIIGATALAGSDAMRIYRAVWTPLYPESVLPQEIAPVEEQEEPGWPRR
jgi:hypothetical protein